MSFFSFWLKNIYSEFQEKRSKRTKKRLFKIQVFYAQIDVIIIIAQLSSRFVEMRSMRLLSLYFPSQSTKDERLKDYELIEASRARANELLVS